MYTASDAFFEALWDLGITHCFVNLGTDHPSLLEAIVKGQNTRPESFPKIITCPNEMVALSMADGYARVTSKPQCVIVHVDVGTQGLGAAVHNASCGRAPVLIFAGMSPYTCEGELRGSRTEYIHWIQDVPDQKQIVGQYCRYTGEIKRGVNVKQMVGRAYQFAVSAPMGPVYLIGSREAMEEEIEPYPFHPQHWGPAALGALPPDAAKTIAEALYYAKMPLVITGYSGRNHNSVETLTTLAIALPHLCVLDTGGSDLCFPHDHTASLGLRYGNDDSIRTADTILILDCDVPWIPTQCKPSPHAKIYHIDSDPLKSQMPVFYLPTLSRYRADSASVLAQLTTHLVNSLHLLQPRPTFTSRALQTLRPDHLNTLKTLATPPQDPASPFTASHLAALLCTHLPPSTIFAIEAVTATIAIADQLRPTHPGTWLNCGGGGLGWSGGAALGIKLASVSQASTYGDPPPLVVAIVGDGTFLFSIPSSVFWIARRYNIPVLTIVLNNKGWNAPRRSLLLVHPDGEGSKASARELGIEFEPQCDYVGIAQAAGGGKEGGDWVWGGKAETWGELERLVPEGVEALRRGRGGVLEARLDWVKKEPEN